MKTSQLLVAAAAMVFMASCGHSDKAAHNEPLTTVDVESPVVDSIVIYKTYPGILHPKRQIEIVARVDGYLTGKFYEDGGRVERGQLLFTIEDTNYKDNLRSATAQLTTAGSQKEYAESHYDALRQALQSNAVSRMEVEQGRATLEQSTAAVASAEAALQTARTQLSYCSVSAPFAGHIISATPDIGTFLAGEASPVVLATLYEDNMMSAEINIEDAGQLENITCNLNSGAIDYNAIPLQFSDSLPHAYTGKLNYLAPAVDVSTGTVTVKAQVDNQYGELRTGMYVSVNLPIESIPNAILIKDAAIGTDQRGSYVYVVNDSNQVVYTPIVPGSTYNDSLRVVTGLSPDAKYVTKALLRVRNGMKVNPKVVD